MGAIAGAEVKIINHERNSDLDSIITNFIFQGKCALSGFNMTFDILNTGAICERLLLVFKTQRSTPIYFLARHRHS
ncbi:hypothetical protein [Undibacterium sp. TJN19]|uniref:hypothetical protein n=1 Tax=Undibacterium sp. TJN19 TaxID=3413055 RepID=UPI003BF028BD